jgi:hypothetical protein
MNDHQPSWMCSYCNNFTSLEPTCLWSTLILSSHVCVGLPSCLFPSGWVNEWYISRSYPRR